jgi:hypothetical protein
MLARRVSRETAGLRQCSTGPLPTHSRSLQCRGGSTTLGNRAATVSSDPTTRRHAAHASDVTARQDVTASIPLKTSFASPRQLDLVQ